MDKEEIDQENNTTNQYVLENQDENQVDENEVTKDTVQEDKRKEEQEIKVVKQEVEKNKQDIDWKEGLELNDSAILSASHNIPHNNCNNSKPQ